MKISAVVSTYNSASVLLDCLQSLTFADEIVVVDHESTDGTMAIAKKFTKRIYSQPNNTTQIDLQKNYGFEKAKGEWVLSVDADERVPSELAAEILRTIDTPGVTTAYRMPRKNIIFGKWIEHSIWWPDYQVRLFQKGKGRYTAKNVHQQLEVEGQIGQLESPLQHENYQSISQYLQKMDVYTEQEAAALFAQNMHMHWSDSINLPVRDFLKTFFLQEGYKDGLHGVVLSSLQAMYAFLVFAKVWEKQGFREENNTNFLKTLFETWQMLQKEIAYWFFTTLASATKNPLEKASLLFKRKTLRTDKKR